MYVGMFSAATALLLLGLGFVRRSTWRRTGRLHRSLLAVSAYPSCVVSFKHGICHLLNALNAQGYLKLITHDTSHDAYSYQLMTKCVKWPALLMAKDILMILEN